MGCRRDQQGETVSRGSYPAYLYPRDNLLVPLEMLDHLSTARGLLVRPGYPTVDEVYLAHVDALHFLQTRLLVSVCLSPHLIFEPLIVYISG